MAIQDIITQAGAILQGLTIGTPPVTALQMVYTNLPSALGQTPCATIMPHRGTLTWPRKPMQREVNHDFDIFLYFSKGGDLSSVDQLLKPYIDAVILLFDTHITLNGTCFNSGITDYNYGGITYAGVDYIGVKFTLHVIEFSPFQYQA